MKISPRICRWRNTFLSLFAACGGAAIAQAQEITFFGEPDSIAPGSISDRIIGGEPFTVVTEEDEGDVTIEIDSIEPAMRGGDPVVPITLLDGRITISSDVNDSAQVTLLATLEVGGVVEDTETRTFTVRRNQTLTYVDLPEVDLGDPSFEVNIDVDPDVGQVRGFRILGGPGEIDLTTGRVNVYGTGGILLQAFGGETSYDPGDPEASLVAATTLNKTLVVGGKEPTGGPGFLDLWTWRAPQLSLTDYLFDVAVNDLQTQFVSVGADGLVIQGSDPADSSTWTEPTPTTTEHLMGVVHGNNRYVAVGMNESVITSVDGINWVDGSAGISAGVDLRAVGFDGDSVEFIAVGTNGMGQSVLYTSPDGMNWVADPSFPSFIPETRAISYSSELGLWQVVGASGSWVYGNPGAWVLVSFGFGDDYNDVLTTEDGVTYVVGDSGTILRTDPGSVTLWTTVNTGANYDLETISTNDRYLIASGEGGRLLRSNLDNGERWVESITPFRFDVQSIAFIEGLLLGVGQNFSVSTSGSGFDWTLRDSSTPGDLNAVAFDGSITVAVGDDGNIHRSTNGGDSWSTPAPGIPEDLRDVISAPVGFLAVGTGGAVYSSADGLSWAPAPSVSGFGGTPYTGNLSAVHYNGTSYAIAGENLTILSSTDGLNWIQRTMGLGDFNDLASKNGTFVVVGDRGLVYTSTNGTQWFSKSSGVLEDLYAVTASDSEFLAVGESGIILTSPNGTTWTSRISTVTQDLFEALYFDESFYAFGEGFALLVSDNSGDWTSQVAPTRNAIHGAAVSQDQFIAVTDLGGILTSPTAGSTGLEEWTFRYPGEAGDDINDVTYGNNGFVAVGDSGQILVSEDGKNWEKKSVQETDGTPLTEDLLGVAYGDGLYLAVGGQKLISSTDTVNWTVVTTWTVPVNSITFGDGLFVVTGDLSTIFYSTNGTNWNGGGVSGIHNAATLRDSAYYPDHGVWIAIGDAAGFKLPSDDVAQMTQLFVSNDGQTWTRQQSPEIEPDIYFAEDMLTVSAGDDMFRAFGNGRLIYYPAFDTWVVEVLSDFPTFASLYSLGNGFGGFVYAGENGAIAGIVPDPPFTPSFLSFPGVTENINGLAFGHESYVAVGDDGRILYSDNAQDWVLRTSANLEPLNGVAVNALGQYVAVGGGGHHSYQ